MKPVTPTYGHMSTHDIFNAFKKISTMTDEIVNKEWDENFHEYAPITGDRAIGEHHLYETVMKAIYGDNYFDVWAKRNKPENGTPE